MAFAKKIDWLQIIQIIAIRHYLFVSTHLGYYYRSIRVRLYWLGQADAMLCGIVCRAAYAYTVCSFVAHKESTTIVLSFQTCLRNQLACNFSA